MGEALDTVLATVSLGGLLLATAIGWRTFRSPGPELAVCECDACSGKEASLRHSFASNGEWWLLLLCAVVSVTAATLLADREPAGDSCPAAGTHRQAVMDVRGHTAYLGLVTTSRTPGQRGPTASWDSAAVAPVLEVSSWSRSIISPRLARPGPPNALRAQPGAPRLPFRSASVGMFLDQ